MDVKKKLRSVGRAVEGRVLRHHISILGNTGIFARSRGGGWSCSLAGELGFRGCGRRELLSTSSDDRRNGSRIGSGITHASPCWGSCLGGRFSKGRSIVIRRWSPSAVAVGAGGFAWLW